jgi:hypothetical protein
VARTDDNGKDSANDESPPTPNEPAGQVTLTVDREAWQRFEYHSLRTRVQRELEETQDMWPASAAPRFTLTTAT